MYEIFKVNLLVSTKANESFNYQVNSINQCLASVAILYLHKTPQNLWFSGFFREYKLGTLGRKKLINCQKSR